MTMMTIGEAKPLLKWPGLIRMGTNFYLQRKVNADGRRQDLHICKISYGWTPSIQGYYGNDYNEPTLKTWFDWKMFLKNEVKNNEGLIFNEYDELISYSDFIKKIEDWQKHGVSENFNNHAVEAHSDSFGIDQEYKDGCWVDPQGYSFNTRDFS